MKALVIGAGGREHAIIRELSNSSQISEVHALPGRAGFLLDQALCHNIDVNDWPSILRVVQQVSIDFVVIGPENPLANGLGDFLRENKVNVVGPSKQAANLEASKADSKKFMEKFNIPTASYYEVSSVDEAVQAAQHFKPPFVLKANGLAAGKGVFICKTLDELKQSSREIFEQGKFKEAGKTALLEEFQSGWELSYLVLTNGEEYQSLPICQDYKRLKESDQGPNTGGMGVVGPVEIDAELEQQIKQQIINPTIEGIKQSSLLYRGVLYVGIMVTENGPKVIEYNVRFGDPEAQVILPLLTEDWGSVLYQLSKGILTSLHWKPIYTACVVQASEGYPERSVLDVKIKGDLLHQTSSSYFLHAGTKKLENGDWVTAGGRVINCIGIGANLKEAIGNAYKQSEYVHWDGMQIRKDIGSNIR